MNQNLWLIVVRCTHVLREGLLAEAKVLTEPRQIFHGSAN